MELMRIDSNLLMNFEGKLYTKQMNSTLEAIKAQKELESMEVEDALEFFAVAKTMKELEVEAVYHKELEEFKAIEDILDFMKDVRENGHNTFEVKGNSIYLKGINISMPELLVKEIANAESEGDEEHLEALINFWSLCAMNPDPRARHDLFEFLKGGKFSITKQGFFVAYRNVAISSDIGQDLVNFVTKTWIHTKTITKKSVNDYYVVKDTDGSLKRVPISSYDGSKEAIIGVLGEIYENLDQHSQVEYTDNYTGTMSIKIGQPVSQDRGACDADPEADCSRGLHVGNKSFLGRGHFGTEGLIVLVNPRNVVAVPHYNENKMRVCEYLPIAVTEYDDNGKLMELATHSLDYDLGEDVSEEISEIMSMTNSEFEEYKQHSFIAPEITRASLLNIKATMDITIEEANDIIKSREL